MLFPTVLGSGKRLFGDTADAKSFKLASSQPAGETLILIYEPATA
jgi:hypothetical protein